jgi:anthranilate synthase component 1
VSPAAGPRTESTPACCWREYPGFPDLARLHAVVPQRYPHLLESVAHGPPQARYDILPAFPGKIVRLTAGGRLESDAATASGDDFLAALDAAWQAERIAPAADLPFPFHGGWFVYLGYELAAFLEPPLRGLPRDPVWPVALAQRFPAAVIRDHAEHKTYVVCEPALESRLVELEHDLDALGAAELDSRLPAVTAIMEEDPGTHRARVARILEYIRAGDTFQVNLSRGWAIRFETDPSAAALYTELRRTNPAPFAALVTIDARRAVVSSSPERLASARAGRVHTRPIAGTFARSDDPQEDADRRRRLVGHPKERAEHIMLVDLERNDLGRVCVPGSIRADELLTVESYRHVHHIVSNVTGRLRPEVTPGAIIRAVFPGGTITGCPKVRTMEIIAELEAAPRRGYTGSVGYLNRDGSLDLNILIRSFMLDGATAELRAGGGIVADSDPQRELEETRAKARGLLAVFGSAGSVACGR